MQAVLNFARDYFLFMLILFLFSYLAPKENYRRYFQFFIGVLMAAILMRPVFALFTKDGEEKVRQELDQLRQEMESVEYYEEGEDIFEWFLEREGMDQKTDE
ncbi:MAG: stage III sporulation protein AF [Muribaculaceae bacterium]|nr:stage III sporulation protein AF [Roseburia sp.]MCM1430535.1 stage III sporulation protein AF [Muribaculaceae bacterium]MCM1492642.1 stage III sporulation protein AF [Muribaculaceae bacterium]